MATELLFRDDAYLKTASARVTAAPGWLMLAALGARYRGWTACPCIE